MSVYIIAEAGASHGGSFPVAVDLIHAANRAGADCIKFQIWNTEKFIAKSNPLYARFKHSEMQPMTWRALKDICDMIHIDFLASAFDIDSVNLLDSMNVKAFKVASGDIVYEPLLKHIGSKGKPVYLSTGMATIHEISAALNWIGNMPITLLKCTVDYPCSEDDVNLKGMENWLKKIGAPYGLSDHTKGHLAGCMAIAMGARVIEKHFALKETEEAIGQDQFAEWVKQIRQAERIMGSGELKTFTCEEKWKPIARRGESGLRE